MAPGGRFTRDTERAAKSPSRCSTRSKRERSGLTQAGTMSLGPLGITEEVVMMVFAELLATLAFPFAGGGVLVVMAAGDISSGLGGIWERLGNAVGTTLIPSLLKRVYSCGPSRLSSMRSIVEGVSFFSMVSMLPKATIQSKGQRRQVEPRFLGRVGLKALLLDVCV